MSCPWESWPQTKLGFCEESLCAWIKQPGNTWSNIGYLAIGYWIWKRAKRDGVSNVRMLAIAAGMTGMGSVFFHASGTMWAEASDLLGMFLGTEALTSLNVRRWLGTTWGTTWAIFILLSLALLGTAGAFPDSERWIYALSGPCCWIELWLYFRDRPKTNYRPYLYAWIVMGLATLFWWMDIARILCSPTNHLFSGHAAWHLLSAAGFYFLYLFYRQFPLLRS